MKRLLLKTDIALFILIVAAAVVGIVLMSGAGSAGYAVIRVDGEEYQRLDLSIDQTIDIDGVHIEVKDGAVAFIESDCPTHACIKTGWLRVPGATAACLPNRISITVTGESGVDAVAE